MSDETKKREDYRLMLSMSKEFRESIYEPIKAKFPNMNHSAVIRLAIMSFYDSLMNTTPSNE